MTPEEYFGDWYEHIDMDALQRALSYIQPRQFYPEANKVFKAFTLCKAEDVHTVMMSQDPYSDPSSAMGVAFGNPADRTEEQLSPSLQIIKEAAIDYTVPHRVITFDNTLESWCRQGILMLNSSLTVKPYCPGSHSLYWRPVIAHLLQSFSLKYPGNVYVLFGKQAQSFEGYIHNAFDIIKVEHPASLARKHEKLPSSLFRKIADEVLSITGKKIQWYQEEDYG